MALKLSSEQLHIVRTVVDGFLPVTNGQSSSSQFLEIVLKCVEQKASQAATRGELYRALAEINRQADGKLLDLCITTASNLVSGYARWVEDQKDIDVYPARQLSDLYHHAETVDWLQKWRDSGGRVSARNEMIALKNDPVWIRISAFGLPFPPFDLDSGMDVDGVSRREAEELGLIVPGKQIEPVATSLNFGPALRQRLANYQNCEASDE